MAGTTLGTAYVQIVPSAQGISGSISNLLDGEGQAAGTSLGSKIGAFAKKALIAAGIGTAVVKGLKASFAEGAALQQSYIGGIDTLYGEAADAARKYAREASAAGISMNNWSEQAVSFGAVLKKTYGDDAAGAADAANRAILAMADNSAKMGTDIESIQMAYQGFAKDNYTMLDNLKLGYGGTKTEMQRLLQDAASMTDVQEELGIAVDANDMSFSNVANAIQVVQKNLGIAGVASQEASETFSGSFNAMKAAAQNFFGSLALGENVSQSLQTLMTSASTFFFGNFIPMLGTIIKSLPAAISTFFAQGIPLLLSNISSLISTLASNITNVAKGLSGANVQQWLTTTIPKLISAAGSMIGQFASSLLQNMPKIVLAIGQIGLAIVQGLGSALWGKVTAAAAGIRDRFLQPINAMRDKVKSVIDKIKGWFPFNIGKIANLKLPHIKLSGKLSLNPPQVPHLSVEWYDKGGIFNSPSIIGVGEKRPEFVGALDDLRNIVREESGNGPITINVYAAPSMDVNQLATEIERRLIRAQNRRRLVWQ